MNKTSNSYILLVFLVFSFFAITGQLQAEPVEAWTRAYDGGSNDNVRGAVTTAYDIKALGRAFAVTGTFWEKRLDGQTLSSQSPGSYAITWDKKVPSTTTSG